MAINILKDNQILSAPAKAKPFKLNDGSGLYVLVKPNGGKYFRFDYAHLGARKTLALGVYPDLTLAEARAKAEAARKAVKDGDDPALTMTKRAKKQTQLRERANSFEAVAAEWFERTMRKRSESHRKRTWRQIERDFLPYIGHMPAAKVGLGEVLPCIRRIESRGSLETARRGGWMVSQILTECGNTAFLPELRAKLPKLTKLDKGHFAACLEPVALGELLRAFDHYQGGPFVKSCLRLAPLLFVRPGELRAMRWADVDLKAAEWRFKITKTHTDLIVPLSRQAVEILSELRALVEPVNGCRGYVFWAGRCRDGSRCITGESLIRALRSLDIAKEESTVHGFRAVARTLLDEVLGFRPDYIEHQLGHAVRDANGRAYNRTSFLAERRRMMQAWADYLDGLKHGAEVIPFPGVEVR